MRAAESLFETLEAQPDLVGRIAVLRERRRSVEAMLRVYDHDGDGVLLRDEARALLDMLTAAKERSSGCQQHITQLPLSCMQPQAGGYAATEVGRAARCELFLQPPQRGQVVAHPHGESALRAVALALCRECMAEEDVLGRAAALRRNRGGPAALLKAFAPHAPDGPFTVQQASAYFAALLAAEAAAWHTIPDHRAAREWVGRLRAAPEGTYPGSELRRVTRILLLTMPQGAVAAETARMRGDDAHRAAADIFRQLQAVGPDLHERRRLYSRERRSLKEVITVFDEDGDGVLSHAEAVACFDLLLSAEAEARGAAPAEPPQVGGQRLLSKAERSRSHSISQSRSGYAVGEIERVARCLLVVTPQGIPRAECAGVQQQEGGAVESAAAALLRRVGPQRGVLRKARGARRSGGAAAGLRRRL
eukprot:TRINITY_DN33661_c0_g2_i2.p1 TRINITY_DN33661_c0_g2~~TRINITY_DN33661_c0_g2_i2.p1  ORF type:complete len:458 (+),score=119.40 TRINITY_DN33661_c0_g2_i2:117-1376(+)